MSNTEIVQLLANGYTVKEIAKENDIALPTLTKKIYILRERCLCKSIAHLVANYLRKKIIE